MLYLAEESYNVHYFVFYPGEKEPSFFEGSFNFLITRLGMSQPSGGTRVSKHLNYPMYFEDFQYHGQGTLTYPDGKIVKGEFKNGEFVK